jgi:hypothetical protein
MTSVIMHYDCLIMLWFFTCMPCYQKSVHGTEDRMGDTTCTESPSPIPNLNEAWLLAVALRSLANQPRVSLFPLANRRCVYVSIGIGSGLSHAPRIPRIILLLEKDRVFFLEKRKTVLIFTLFVCHTILGHSSSCPA